MIPQVMRFTTEGEGRWIKVIIEDGSEIEVLPTISAISKVGYDETGLPIYKIGASTTIRVLKIPNELIKTTETTKPPNIYQ
jgi:hypothetical protein